MRKTKTIEMDAALSPAEIFGGGGGGLDITLVTEANITAVYKIPELDDRIFVLVDRPVQVNLEKLDASYAYILKDAVSSALKDKKDCRRLFGADVHEENPLVHANFSYCDKFQTNANNGSVFIIIYDKATNIGENESPSNIHIDAMSVHTPLVKDADYMWSGTIYI